MKNFTVSTILEDTFQAKNQYDGVYLHGDLQDEKDYDIFSFDENWRFEYGIHTIKINGKEAVLFIWEPEKGSSYKNRGYLVYAGDTEAMQYAAKSYSLKSDLL